MPESNAPAERFIDELLDHGAKVITVAEIMDLIGKSDDETEQNNLKGQVIRALDYHEILIPETPGESYVNAEKLFNGAEFLIVPDALEIDNNILIPGHRLCLLWIRSFFLLKSP